MDAYHEFIEPTRVSHSIACNFISPKEKHLIVAKSTLLQIFAVTKFPTKKNTQSPKLRLVEQFKLHGVITDLKAIKTVENPDLHYVLVSTKFAKMSLIKWSHKHNSISTVSLHYYEDSIREATFETLTKTQLIVEPNNSACAVMRFKNILTFLPFEVIDDDDDEDDDEDIHDDVPNGHRSKRRKALSTVKDPKLYNSLFMLDAQSLDSSIGEIIDMQFLHNYREPTLAVIYDNATTWAGLLPKVKDNVNFMILSMDLVSKSTTMVLKVENLPYEIDRIISLPRPFNGSLLVGCNELIHIDSGGISRRIAVNQYTENTTSIKNYLDQSSLNLKLEHCTISPVKTGDNKLLLISQHGEFYFINFEIDGKSIKLVSVEKCPEEHYQGIDITYPGDVALLADGVAFVANKNGDSLLLAVDYLKEVDPENPKNSPMDEDSDDAENARNEADNKKNDDDDDDLYADDDVGAEASKENAPLVFSVLDKLINLGPVSNFTLGHYSADKFKANLKNPNFKEISIVANCGSHKNSAVSIMVPSVQPSVLSSLSFSEINRMWTVSNKFLITSDDVNLKSEIFQINRSFARLNAPDFLNDQATISMFEISGGTHSVQITSKAVNLYDAKFKKLAELDKILTYDDNGDSNSIIFGTLSDDILLITMSTGEAHIYQINTYSAKFIKVPLPKLLQDSIITTGYITNSTLLNEVNRDVSVIIPSSKRKRNSVYVDDAGAPVGSKSADLKKNKMIVLVTGDNRLVVFTRFHNEKCFQLNDLAKFSNHLQLGFFETKEEDINPFIKQVILNTLGNASGNDDEYLTVLTVGGEIIMYKLFYDGVNFKFIKQNDLKITGAPLNTYSVGTTIERRLIYMKNNNGFSGIFVSGNTSYWISKTYQSIPRIFRFTNIPAVSFSAYSDNKSISNGFIYLDNDKNARICELLLDFNYENNWPVKKIPIPHNETVKCITYHETSCTFAISSYCEIPYNCIDEENNPIVGTNPDKPSALSYKGYVHLLSPFNWTIIDTVELDDNEIAMSVKSMVLDVAISMKKLKTKQKKEFIVIGTGKYRMEDLGANGSFKIYEIIDIIPEPGRPETNHKFKEFCKEDTKGAVNMVCEVSGRFLVSQGQKIIVRDIQDNGTVPVAFLDTSVYVSEAKSFGNLIILGDPLKSVWLAGFDADPFRMIMLGKDLQKLDVTCADFIIRDEDIFILVADLNNVLHLLQYDPEDPSSFNGQRLLQKASFNINSNATCMRSIPKNEEIHTVSLDNYQTIGSTIDGLFFSVFPVSESTYRRMYIVQQQIIDKEYHYCGLNPRLNRLGNLTVTETDNNVKPFLDYEVIKMFAHLNEDRKRNLLVKVGSNTYQEIWKDLIEFENVLKL